MQNTEIFIIWEKARHKEKEILQDISNKFQILQVFDIQWAKNKIDFSLKLKKFYNKSFFSCLKKAIRCGHKNFSLIVVSDPNPLLLDKDRRGIIKNDNMLKAKSLYRKMAHKNFLVHASDNNKEALENISNIFKKYTIETLLKAYGTISDTSLKIQKLKPIKIDLR